MSETQTGFSLSPEQRTLLASVVDELVPPRREEGVPGAGGLGLADAVEEVAREAPDLASAIVRGLARLDGLAKERDPRGFASLAADARLEILNEASAAEPAFLPGLVMRTYMAYYSNERVLEALGLEPRPPHPGGYAMEPNDLSLLDDVRRRAKLYRKC